MKSLIKHKSPIIDWSNYSKSAVAIAMDAPISCSGEWHEFILVPERCEEGYGFWTLLGISSDCEDELTINKRFEPKFKGSWKKSLHVRPEIEKEVSDKLKINLPACEWDDSIIECVNDWLNHDIKMSIKHLQSIRQRDTENSRRKPKKVETRKYYDEEDEQRIA